MEPGTFLEAEPGAWRVLRVVRLEYMLLISGAR